MVTLRESILEERKSKKDFVGEATEEARIKEGRPIRSFTDRPELLGDYGVDSIPPEPVENIRARTEQGPSYWEGVPDVKLGEFGGKIHDMPEKPPAWLGQDIDRNEFRQSVIDKHFDGVDPLFIRPNEKATESFDPAFFPEEHAKAVQKIKAKRSENLNTLTGVMDLFDKEMEIKEKFEKKETATKIRKEKKETAAQIREEKNVAAAQKERMDVRINMLTAGGLIKEDNDEAYKKAGFGDKADVIEYIGLLNERLVELGFPDDVKKWEESTTEEEKGAFKIAWDFWFGEKAETEGALKTETQAKATEAAAEPKGIPPAAEHKDRIVKDTTTNKRYKSDGTKWIEIE